MVWLPESLVGTLEPRFYENMPLVDMNPARKDDLLDCYG